MSSNLFRLINWSEGKDGSFVEQVEKTQMDLIALLEDFDSLSLTPDIFFQIAPRIMV